MRTIRNLLLAALFAATPAAQAAEEDDDWKMFGGILSLVQSFVRIAASTDDPQVMQKHMDGMLAGRNGEANRIAGDLMKDMFEDMPAQYRGTVNALARDVLTIARRENARNSVRGLPADIEAVMQARKDLNAMGLRYWDEEQYREALRRNDALALDLYARAGAIRTPQRAN
jgi:hypothetical protein